MEEQKQLDSQPGEENQIPEGQLSRINQIEEEESKESQAYQGPLARLMLNSQQEEMKGEQQDQCYSQLNDVLLSESAFKENQINKLSQSLPQEHVVRAQKQFQLVEAFNAGVLEDMHVLNAMNLKLREKIRQNLNSPQKRFGYLKHDINDYFDCIPLMKADQFRDLLEEDRQVWKSYSEEASDKVKQVTLAYEKLIEEHKRKLEEFVRESQNMLMNIPVLEAHSQNVPNNSIVRNSQQAGKKKPQDMQSLVNGQILHQPAVFVPELQRMTVFGDASLPVDLEFPSSQDLQAFPLDQKIKLNSIVWRSGSGLEAIRLKFTNAIESPLFEKGNRQDLQGAPLKSIEINTVKRISSVSVRVSKMNNQLNGLRLKEESGGNVAELVWNQSGDGNWINRDIPESMEIIGLYLSNQGMSEHIQSLGFILWRPNSNVNE